MNYLAHFYLSFENSEVLIGNYLGDFLRKNEIDKLPDSVRKGVYLHREIDKMMDTDLVSKSSKSKFGNHRHYASVIIDVVYDHFLAKNWNHYSHIPLHEYADRCYASLENHQNYFNEKAAMHFYYMKKRNWIEAYPTVEGIDLIFQRMSKRTPYDNSMHGAAQELVANYEELEQEFFEFFPRMRAFCEAYLKR